jgi:phosphotransferase system IIB component
VCRWGSGIYGNATSASYSQSGLAAGTYTINIKDANGCTTGQTVNITQPSAALSSSVTAQTNVLCYGNSAGSFSIQAANGTGPYQYALGNGSYGSATNSAYSQSALAAGSYTVNIRDFNGCTASQAVIISQPSAALSSVIVSQTNVSCYGNNTGSFTIQATNGTAPYQYALGNSPYGTASSDSYSQSGLAAGSYVINIKDANGCTTSQTVNISQPSAALGSSITAQTNVLCYGQSTGSSSVQAANGTAPYQYALGSGSYGNATTIPFTQNGLAAGSYIVNIKDANGCNTSQTVNISQPSAPLSSNIVSQSNVSCYGTTTGSFRVTGS